jgi:hypothetical protein|tara:strand:+ start:2713 stop:3336 length:624 start_codon:yes stop_codon:yes gene_type:complete
MGFKIDIKKYDNEYSSYGGHMRKLIEETVSDVIMSGKINIIQERLLLDLELIIRVSGMGDSSFTPQEILGKQDMLEESVVSEKKILGIYDFIDSEKDDASRRKAFWILIHQVNQEIVRNIGSSKEDLTLIVPEDFIPILEKSVSFISGTDERHSSSTEMLGGSEFKGESVYYSGRLNDSNYTIYSIKKRDFIYVALKDGRYAMIKIK